MTVTAVHKDAESLTMSISAEFDVGKERVWQLWSDPRQLERWWGPPTYPATMTVHELQPGGEVRYHMTGPEGDQHHGHWRIIAVNEPDSLSFLDTFADQEGNPNEEMPQTDVSVLIEDLGDGRTRMSISSVFESVEAMEQMLAMGMEEGMTLAMGQIDAILAGQPVR
ncbi:MAG TPA: SRPBCC domain-containing protein [Acidimicrobiia bacterium]|nr:SRPBCC domain-containing protein [Acidimicrobiia bacterium]